MRKFMAEFKEFVSRGNVMDMAVGIIIGSAFTAIVTALVNNLITPLINLVTGGGTDTSFLNFSIGNVQFLLGDFVGAIINFLLVALVLFSLIKAMNTFRKKEDPPAPSTQRDCPYCLMKIEKAATRCPYCTAVVEPVLLEEDPAPEM
ncbi:large conductance mechanosensitive channel protein MscL [Eubacteriales bacterium OttesenSCG-928-M02]|nr:large conductance mechanosensitive channel protein MscL [Eubacteriales bacterium OttesenSCG-928-M02]